jgi:hypothetical protein
MYLCLYLSVSLPTATDNNRHHGIVRLLRHSGYFRLGCVSLSGLSGKL